jgi:hypothetical protein
MVVSRAHGTISGPPRGASAIMSERVFGDFHRPEFTWVEHYAGGFIIQKFEAKK